MTFKFHEKKVLLTGAASGIGLCLAKKLLAKKCHVVGVDIDVKGLESLKQWSDQNGFRFTFEVLNLLKKESIGQVIKKIWDSEECVDVLINCAGIADLGWYSKQSEQSLEKVMDLNFMAPTLIIKDVLPLMEERGRGLIVNLASVAGFIAPPLMSSYAASKHALVGFHRSLQMELEMNMSPVKMLLVSPGFVDTKIINKGKELGFPEWLGFMLSKPEKVADEIILGMARSKKEIFPTLNGKLMLAMNRLAPKFTVNQSKILLTKSPKDWLINKFKNVT